MINKNDFIEIEFTGKITDTNEIFDTNIKADAKSANFKTEGIKPLILSVGHKMLPKGFDNNLTGKEVGKDYEVNLKSEEAFGKRNPQLVRMIPTKHFHEQKINPVRGMQLNLDGQIVKILSSDRGRTLVDFNNPLAGKPITYTYKINKIITDQKEKINALQDFLFQQIFDYEVKEKTITFKVPKEAEQFIKMFSPKFEEILGLKVESEVVEEKKKPEE
ncbi:FKBP-type peptidyl-prolyl cis-trans isomerase [Candidatus Pacearchaeota archaeon]|nr:FKBP-type peptidyl-prolyl cis-trans isomerase [Candidatus Pacearchaeota archaeon]